jgi:hypothetical protein
MANLVFKTLVLAMCVGVAFGQTCGEAGVTEEQCRYNANFSSCGFGLGFRHLAGQPQTPICQNCDFLTAAMGVVGCSFVRELMHCLHALSVSGGARGGDLMTLLFARLADTSCSSSSSFSCSSSSSSSLLSPEPQSPCTSHRSALVV